MRLLHTTTLKMHEFVGGHTPPYFILSHTWGEEEMTFQDMELGFKTNKKGFEKIRKCCEVGAADGFEYVWIDTCCIDKTSISELSEAINSMFRWYKEAVVCYVILSDVPAHDDAWAYASAFAQSRWFTRGWTLQELIAPSNIIFFNQEWVEIGTKWNLRRRLSEISGIQTEVLEGGDLGQLSVAQRMSWAAERDKTRVEDIAYCLMGLFAINMPMLYGEGRRAFTRLQEEILKTTDYQTIFAWRAEPEPGYEGSFFASHPSAFTHSGKFVRTPNRNMPQISFTNGLIGLTMDYFPIEARGNELQFYAVLKCREIGKDTPLAISTRQPAWGREKEFFRTNSIMLFDVRVSAVERGKLTRDTVYNRVVDNRFGAQASSKPRCRLQIAALSEHGIILHDSLPKTEFGNEAITGLRISAHYEACFMRFRDHSGNTFDLRVEFTAQSTSTIMTAALRQRRSSSPLVWPDSMLGNLTSLMNDSDRLDWHWWKGHLRIFVSIKQAVENGEEANVVNVWCEPVNEVEEILNSEVTRLEVELKRLNLELQYGGPS